MQKLLTRTHLCPLRVDPAALLVEKGREAVQPLPHLLGPQLLGLRLALGLRQLPQLCRQGLRVESGEEMLGEF